MLAISIKSSEWLFGLGPWVQNVLILYFSPFPTVAESIQKELDEYRSSEEEVKKLKNMMVSKACIQNPLLTLFFYHSACLNDPAIFNPFSVVRKSILKKV